MSQNRDFVNRFEDTYNLRDWTPGEDSMENPICVSGIKKRDLYRLIKLANSAEMFADAANEFCHKVLDGKARSIKTYATFSNLLHYYEGLAEGWPMIGE